VLEHDYSEHVEKPDPATVIAVVDQSIAALKYERGQVAVLELQFKKAQERVRELEEKTIPELLTSIGWREGSKLVTPAGHKVELKKSVHASIYAAHREEVFEWLDNSGNGGMVKRKVIVPFGRDDEDKVRALEDLLKKDYPNVGEERKVEPATFSAWVRQRVEAGEELPPDSWISIEDKTVAKIS
jgi:hypothetical protein